MRRGLGSGPVFKPGFSPDRLLCAPDLGRLCALRRELVEAVGGIRPELGQVAEHDLLAAGNGTRRPGGPPAADPLSPPGAGRRRSAGRGEARRTLGPDGGGRRGGARAPPRTRDREGGSGERDRAGRAAAARSTPRSASSCAPTGGPPASALAPARASLAGPSRRGDRRGGAACPQLRPQRGRGPVPGAGREPRRRAGERRGADLLLAGGLASRRPPVRVGSASWSRRRSGRKSARSAGPSSIPTAGCATAGCESISRGSPARCPRRPISGR